MWEQRGDFSMKHSTGITKVCVRLFLVFSVCLFLVGVPVEAGAEVVPIHEIQSNATPWGASTYEGEIVTITGVVTATHYFGYVVAEAPGPWGAILVYSYTEGPDIGDEMEVTGFVAEYYGLTEIGYVLSATKLSSGCTVESTLVSVADVSQEMYESVLVSVADVDVVALPGYGEWVVSDGSPDYLICDDLSDYMYVPKIGDELDSITGIVAYDYGEFKLDPRFTNDIVGAVIPHYALHGHVVTMNDVRDVNISAYVEVLGDEIVAIHESRPAGIPVMQAGGLIYPGLIDSHNHPTYNVLDIIPFDTLFEDRYEWRATELEDDFGTQLNSFRHYGGYYAQYVNMWKLAEVRAMTAGTTSIQGTNSNGEWNNDFAHPLMGINNVSRFPARVYHQTFPLWQSAEFWMEKYWEYWDRFIVHIAEGVNSAALDEFYAWSLGGMLDWRTTIIHGVALGDTEWAAMGAAGANLVWSPQSNMALYGQTADVPGALAAGVNVALAPDWTESGSQHILDELKVADSIDNDQWGDVLSPQQLAEFVTRNAARATGSEHLIGQITPGYRANFMVIPGSPMKPYKALLKADPVKVKLTVVHGKPRYGNPDIMAQFGFLEGVESIIIGGEEKSLALQVDAPHIPEADKPFAQVMSELEAAYAASEPKVCAFLGLE
jgi:hypothetical protein